MWICSLLCVQSVADVVRRGILRWFGHLERKSVDDWVSACRNVEVAGARCKGEEKEDLERVCEGWHWSARFAIWVGSVQGCVEGLCHGFPLFFQDGIPWLFPDFPWLLKWNSRYPVNSKNGSFWKINVIFLSAPPPPTPTPCLLHFFKIKIFFF